MNSKMTMFQAMDNSDNNVSNSEQQDDSVSNPRQQN